MTQSVPEQPPPSSEHGFRWAWPLRISAQIFPAIWVWKFYGCMQMMDCSDPTHSERLIAHALLAGIVAFGVEVILLVNRALDSME